MPLAALLWQEKGASLAIVRRFSAVAVVVVAILILTGLVLAIIQIESLAALIDTNYGIILSIKLLLVASLLVLAALNRFRFTPALEHGAKTAQPLLRSMLAECVLGAIILLAIVNLFRRGTVR